MIFEKEPQNETSVEKNTVGHLCANCEGFNLIYEAMICKKGVWPTLGCKVSQSDPIVMKLKLDLSCRLLNVYTKLQTDISKHVEKVRKTRTDGWTDGQVDIATA